MKVKVRKGDCQSALPGIIIVSVIFLITVPVLVMFFLSLKDMSIDEFFEVFSDIGMLILFAGAFFLLDIYMIRYLFKKPKGYKARLDKKEQMIYQGHAIWQMQFSLVEKTISPFKQYLCYTTTEPSFKIGSIYNIYIKEFNWQVVEVNELEENDLLELAPNIQPSTMALNQERALFSEQGSNDNIYQEDSSNLEPEIKDESLTSVVLVFLFIFGGGIIFLLAKCIYDLKMGNSIFGNIVAIGFCAMMCGGALYVKYGWNKDLKPKDIPRDAIDRDLNKSLQFLKHSSILKGHNKKSPGFIVRHLPPMFLKYISFVLIMMTLIVLIQSGIDSSVRASFSELLKSDLIFMGQVSLFCIFFAGIELLFKLPFINYDKSVLIKNKVNVRDELIDIKQLRKYRIKKDMKVDKAEKYFILDELNNLVYTVDAGGLRGKTYIISDNLHKKVGEIKRKDFKLSYNYVVRIINKKPFSIRKKVEIDYGYEILGLSYKMDGLYRSAVCKITNEAGQDVAIIKGLLDKEGNFNLGSILVEIVDGQENNEEITFIILAIFMSNYHFIG